MKRFALVPVLILFFILPGCDNAGSSRPLPPIEVHFSPKGGCTDAIVAEINSAQSSLLIQAYSFTSKPIAQAVVAAFRRGVHVEVIIDDERVTETNSLADELYEDGIPVLVDSEHAIAHNKVMLIDGRTVITGSFNFTRQAENGNAENLLTIRDSALADQYTINWKRHADHSRAYTGKPLHAGKSRN
jgi:phosphatidylserine/phosphatidylglycerophosphate/cardiolipin synthase-like enzyme